MIQHGLYQCIVLYDCLPRQGSLCQRSIIVRSSWVEAVIGGAFCRCPLKVELSGRGVLICYHGGGWSTGDRLHAF